MVTIMSLRLTTAIGRRTGEDSRRTGGTLDWLLSLIRKSVCHGYMAFIGSVLFTSEDPEETPGFVDNSEPVDYALTAGREDGPACC